MADAATASASAAKPKAQNPIIKAYLAIYNLAAACAWAFFIFQIYQYYEPQLKKSGFAGLDHSGLYDAVHSTLDIVQTSAILEIFHSAFGFVKSPIATTFIQVFSRLGVLWGIVHNSPPSQVHWGFAMMAISWAVVEVPRYVFYLLKLFGDSYVPYPLKWLRYSLFLVLYPSGISGEIICLLNSLDYVKQHGIWTVALPNAHNLAFNYYAVLVGLLLTYVPGGPFMIFHMWNQRKKELGGQKAKPE